MPALLDEELMMERLAPEKARHLGCLAAEALLHVNCTRRDAWQLTRNYGNRTQTYDI